MGNHEGFGCSVFCSCNPLVDNLCEGARHDWGTLPFSAYMRSRSRHLLYTVHPGAFCTWTIRSSREQPPVMAHCNLHGNSVLWRMFGESVSHHRIWFVLRLSSQLRGSHSGYV